jgi:hypothetical protein
LQHMGKPDLISHIRLPRGDHWSGRPNVQCGRRVVSRRACHTRRGCRSKTRVARRVRPPRARRCSPMRTDQKRPTFFKWSDGSLGSAFNRPNDLSASSRTDAGRAR